MVLVTKPDNALFDLRPWVGQRSATFKFLLVDGITKGPITELHPIRGQAPTLTHDTTRTIKRTLSPLVLAETETALIDPISQRIELSMIINDQEWPLGRYVFIDHTRMRTTQGQWSNSSLVDEMFIVDQKIEQAFSCRTLISEGVVTSGEVVKGALERLLAGLPITFLIESTDFGSVGSWPQGTSRGRIVDDLALDGDYFSPWFGNDGEMHVIRSFDPADVVPTFDLDANNVVIRDSITETNDLVDAPNRILVVSNTPNSLGIANQIIVGTYDIPSSAPHSQLNRGFLITDVRELQIATTAQAIAVAQNLGQRGTVFERVELSTPPDPRHDSYDVIRWNGANWLELSWSLVLQEGADMRHTMRKVYR